MIEIPLTRGKVALVDDKDADLASVSWQAHRYKDGVYYARRSVRTTDGFRTVMLHREIWARAHPGEEVPRIIDHENRDGLDCRRGNLRRASAAQNAWNQRMHRDNRSGYVGVRYMRGRNLSKPWRADMQSRRDGFRVLGYFATAEEAARARDAAVRAARGEFARVNFPGPGEHSVRCQER